MVANVIEWASVSDVGSMHTITLYAASPEEFAAFSNELTGVLQKMSGQ